MKTWPVVFLAIAMLAGCTDDSGEIEPATEVFEEPAEIEPTFGPHSGLPLERPASYLPSLDTAPEWVLGEWWTIEITDGFVGETHTVTRIVAGKEGPDYLVGMPIEDFNDEVMILHFPGFGLVQKDTHGHEAHDFMFEPLSFPLAADETWESLWQGANSVLTHQVVTVDEAAGTAEIQAFGSQNIEYTYDAEIGAITEFNAPGYMSYRVLDHGFDYEGTVRVPHSHDLIFFDGRLGPVVDITNGGLGTVDAPIETLTVPDLYDRSSFSFIAFELLPALSAAAQPTTAVGHGVYDITATAPDGEEFHMQKLPTEGGHKIESFHHDDPVGDWTLQVVAAGPVQLFMEGIGYVVFDVNLPEGCVQVTEKVHDHGGVCGGHVHDIE